MSTGSVVGSTSSPAAYASSTSRYGFGTSTIRGGSMPRSTISAAISCAARVGNDNITRPVLLHASDSSPMRGSSSVPWSRASLRVWAAEVLASFDMRVSLTVFSLLALGAACIPSHRLVHDGNRYFEQCYGADFDPQTEPAQKEACWQAWMAHYTRHQAASRVDYAMRRIEALQSGEPPPSLPGLGKQAPQSVSADGGPLASIQYGTASQLRDEGDAGAGNAIPNGCLEACNAYEGRCVSRCPTDSVNCRPGCSRERVICLGGCH